jgi:hypothetical protein
VVSVAKPPHTFRIVALGGSALYGEGMESEGLYPRHRALFNDETVAAVLERDLNERLNQVGLDLDVEVINPASRSMRVSSMCCTYSRRSTNTSRTC